MVGRVVSTKAQKTATVLVERKKSHPVYKKTFARSKKYLVDDPFGVKDGDIVILTKIHPVSKNKHWQIAKVLGSDFVSLEQAELQEAATEAIAEVLPEEKEETTETVEANAEVDKSASAKVTADKEEKAERKVRKPRAKKGEEK